ncbi:ATP-dependent RNA helicase DDX20 [Entomortierella parvispora]|uniref:RNA helicase n=1 Tax=Entomortierella parvispora TaxID=205924 RepID=A0A9P3HLM9_9FUNG|nr:ATP-dependent RNA helicase DDX20 [Entomortierella parvispora]
MTLDRFHSSDVRISEDLDFSSLVSNPALLKGLVNSGYQRPSPIQLKTIPLGRLGLDLIAQAKSGTGKTIVFSVIAIEAVLSSQQGSSNQTTSSPNGAAQDKDRVIESPRAVIVAPTREIAVQIQEVILNLVRSELADRVTCHVMIGGMPIAQDRENLKNCSIVVGTPGRIKSLLDTDHLKTDNIRLLVLDEADKLMESVFKGDIFAIAKGLGPVKQVMAFSATYDDALLAELDHLVKNPVYVMLTDGTPELEGVMQYFKVAQLDEKQKKGSVFLKQDYMAEAKFSELEGLFTHVPFYQAMVFLNHRGRASNLVTFLNKRGWPSMHITSGISQTERLEIMSKTRKFELRVLVCSDLIARGIDVDRVNLVVNLDLPKDPETYLHRIGRTGRYGTTGLAVSIVDKAELKTIEILQKEYHLTIQELSKEDKVFSELTDRSKNRHHERPLQAAEDKDQFEKLEAERLEREGYVPSEDEAEGDSEVITEMVDESQEAEADSFVKFSASAEPLPRKQNTSRKSRKRQHPSQSSIPMAISSDFDKSAKRLRLTEEFATMGQLDEQEEYAEEQYDEQEREGLEEDGAYHTGAEEYYPFIPQEAGYGTPPMSTPFYPFHGTGEYAGRYDLPWYPSDQYAHYYHSAYYRQPATPPFPTRVFFPPDLVLFPASPYSL